jgi:hypothetical protein
VVAIGAVGLGGAYWLPRTSEDRLGAFIGMASAVFSGVVALALKKRALAKSLKSAMSMLGIVFGMRMLLVLVGLGWVMARRWGSAAYVIGFFSAYFALQWVEISYVLAESKRRGNGGE